MSDLPPELLKELSKKYKKIVYIKDKVLNILKACERQMTIDEILIELFKRENKVYMRQSIYCLVYRLSRIGIVKKQGNTFEFIKTDDPE